MPKISIMKTTLIALAVSTSLAATAIADTQRIDVAAGDLMTALEALAKQADVDLVYRDSQVKGLITAGVSGNLSPENALAKLLEGTPLVLRVDKLSGALLITTPQSGGGPVSAVTSLQSSDDAGVFRLAHVGEQSDSARRADNGISQHQNDELSEIVVTASRREQPLKDVPAAITAVNPKKFAEAGLNTLDDIVNYTPGFATIGSIAPRGHGSDGIIVRGIAPQAGAVVAVYLDDAAITTADVFSGGEIFDGFLYDLDRVEMIKGPQSTLYGAISLAGTIRYITRKPALDEARGHVSIDLSDTRHGDLNKIYSGNISIPLIKDKLGLSLAGFLDDTGGLVDRINPDTGEVIKKNADEARTYGFSGDLLFQASDELSWRFKALHQGTTWDGYSQVNLANANKDLLYGIANDSQFSDFSLSQSFFSADVNYDFGWATLTSDSSYGSYHNRAFDDETPIYAAYVDDVQGLPPGTTTLVAGDFRFDRKHYAQELRLTSVSNQHFEWIAGFYFSKEDLETKQRLVAQPNDFTVAFLSWPNVYKEQAAFANATYYVTPKFDVGVGSRYSRNRTALTLITEGPLIESIPSDAERVSSQNVATYLLTSRYRPTENVSLYARMASGYRPPSANIVFKDPETDEPLVPIKLDADKLWSYEAGAKGDVANGFFSYDFAVWRVDWKKFKTAISINGLGTLSNAEGGINARGFEGSFTLRPIDGLNLIWTAAYADSALNRDEPGLNGLKDQRVPKVPKWTLSARSLYDFDVSSSVKGNLGAGVRYTSSAPSTFYGYDPTSGNINVPSDSYVLVDLNGGIRWGRASLGVYVKNAFDSMKLETASGFIPFGSTDFFGTGSIVRPRTIGAIFSYDF